MTRVVTEVHRRWASWLAVGYLGISANPTDREDKHRGMGGHQETCRRTLWTFPKGPSEPRGDTASLRLWRGERQGGYSFQVIGLEMCCFLVFV